MSKIFTLCEGFFHYLENSNVDLEKHLTNTNFLSLSERLLKRKVPMLAEKWGIQIKDDDLEVFNLSSISICWSYTNKKINSYMVDLCLMVSQRL